jgi:hypothetical protein
MLQEINNKNLWLGTLSNCVMRLRDLIDGKIVGTGSDFVVILKDKKRILMHLESFRLVELRKDTTPYGSDC